MSEAKQNKPKRFKIQEIARFFGLHRNTVTEYLRKYDQEFGLDLRDPEKTLHCIYWLKDTLPHGKTKENSDGVELSGNGSAI